MSYLIRAKFVLPISDTLGRSTRISDGYVLYNNGTILEVGAYSEEIGKALLEKYSPLHVIGLKKDYAESTADIICLPGVLLPGFVKAHGHDHESPIIGIEKDVPLTVWLDGAVNVFNQFVEENEERIQKELGRSSHSIVYRKARLDDIYYGITTALTHHCGANKYYVPDLVSANEEAGTRIIIGVGSQDRNFYEKILDASPEVVVNRVDKFYQEFKGLKRTSIIPGPDQIFSNGPEVLKAVKKWADDHDSLIHIHGAEEYNTTQWFNEKYGTTQIEYVHSLGFLGPKTIIAHQVHSTEKELEILRDTKTKVVHNPLANTILGSGMPDVPTMLEMGIKVAISTDGSGSADNQNILAAARLASQYQKAVYRNPSLLSAQQVLEMITIEPAQILGINAGSLDAGKDADMVLIDLRRPNMIPTKASNVVENLIWASDGSEVRYVIANGRMLKDDYKITTMDTEEAFSEVQLLSEQFDQYKEKIGRVRGTGVHQ